MEQEYYFTFGPFRFDVTQGCVWQGDQAIALRPQSLALLRYLVAHPGRLVTKTELRQHVWAGTHVSDTVLRVGVHEIRQALGDVAAAPRYLETVGRQGYRFLLDLAQEAPPPRTTGPLVGRRDDVAAVEQWFERAAGGTRQLVLLSGESGIGKTTVVDMVLARLGPERGVRIARGQCTEHYGEGEPYLPFLEALGQLCRGPQPADVLAVLRRYAPLWLGQLLGVLSEAEQEHVQRYVQGASAARMLRELAEALEVLTADVPLVVVLEDLQLLGTYRPVEMALRAQPLRGLLQEICGQGQAVEVRLELLPPEAVTAYVSGRLEGPVAAPLAALLLERTEGNALFLVNIVEHLVGEGLVVRRDGQWTLQDGAEAKVLSLPEGLRQFLMRHLEALSLEERRVLDVASVAGERFTVAAVAAGAQGPVEEVEAVCEALAAQQHFLADLGLREWPDGTSSGCYRFVHALYRQVLYEGLGSARRRELHCRIGLRLEAGYGAQVGEVAARLAIHFERGGEVQRAIHYWQQTGDNAARRNAHPEAVDALRQSLALLSTLPDSPERIQRELALQLTLGELLMATQGIASPAAGDAYSRAHGLCQQVGETLQLFRALYGLCTFHSAQAQLYTGRAFGQQFFALAQRQRDPVLVCEGHLLLGTAALDQGDPVTARAHLEQSLALAAAPPPAIALSAAGLYPQIESLTKLMRVLWLLGYADQAQRCGQDALALAQHIGHPPSVVYAAYFGTTLAQCRRDVVATHAQADALMALAQEQGLEFRVEQGRILRGWALAMQGDAAAGVAQICEGLAAHERSEVPQLVRHAMLALLAEAYGQAGQPEMGLRVLAEALTLVATTEARCWEAELHRLQGELLLHLPSPAVPQAEAAFLRALEVARRQQAKALELRAALSLARLWQGQGQRAGARQLLGESYSWFTEGFDTPDLQEAEALLAELGVLNVSSTTDLSRVLAITAHVTSSSRKPIA